MSNVIQWINEKIINSEINNIDKDDIDAIRDFTLLWNLFEALCCNKFADMNIIYRLINDKIELFNEIDYQDIFDYFYNRYENDINKFNKLNIRSRDQRILVEKVLNNEYEDKENRLKFIMVIIYRYRNNLFHGEKNMAHIRYQKENFEKTNEFLMYFIETCKGN